MRTRLHFTVGALLLTFAAYGCHGAAPATQSAEDPSQASQDQTDEKSPTTSASPTTPPPPPPASPATSTAPAGGADGTPASTTTPPVTTPPVTTPPVTTPPVTPVACTNGGVAEVEANDSSVTSIGAATAFCGAISSAADVDSFSFTLPANATGLSWSASFSAGGAGMTITAGGATTSMNEAPPWFPGQVYVVTVTGPAPLSYSVTLNIGQ